MVARELLLDGAPLIIGASRWGRRGQTHNRVRRSSDGRPDERTDEILGQTDVEYTGRAALGRHARM